jgi:hypothetical protein
MWVIKELSPIQTSGARNAEAKDINEVVTNQ